VEFGGAGAHLQGDGGLVGEGADAINSLVHKVFYLAGFHDQFNLAGFEPFEAEDVVHQTHQAIAVFMAMSSMSLALSGRVL
jgi:hypothetical protein